MPKPVNKLTQAEILSVLHYDRDTGVFTHLFRNGGTKSDNVFNALFAGKVAGSVRKDGYRQITIRNKHYLAQRIAWLYVTGVYPDEEIDHEDTIKDHNWFDNLRDANRKQNAANKDKYGKTAIAKNIYRKGNRFRLLMTIDRKSRTIGYFNTLEEAQARHDAIANENFGKFARAA